MKRRSGRKQIIVPDAAEPDADVVSSTRTYHDAMVIALARAFRWKKLLDEGKYTSIRQMANDLGVVAPYMGRLIRLTLLSPEIIEAIVDGREPDGMSLEKLRRPMPLHWGEQRTEWEFRSAADPTIAASLSTFYRG